MSCERHRSAPPAGRGRRRRPALPDGGGGPRAVRRPEAVAGRAHGGDDRPDRGRRSGRECPAHPLLRPGPAGRPPGRGALRRPARWTAAARGHPGRRQGRSRGGRTALHRRLAGLQGHDRRGHRRQRAARDRRRRDHPRPLGHARVLLRGDHRVAAVGSHPQPLEPGLQPRRLVGRLGRGPGGRHGDPGDRLRHRWLDPHPGVVLRRRRLQAAVRQSAADAAVQPRPLLPRGPHGAQRRRLPPARERDVPGRTPRTSPRCDPSSPSRRSCHRSRA